MAVCNVQQMNLLVRNAEHFGQNEIKEIVECFSFDSMMNINILNYQLIKLYIAFLEKLIQHDVFFSNSNAVIQSLTFVLSNLQLFKDDYFNDILGWLLHLLSGLINRGKNFQPLLAEIFQPNREKIFDIVAATLALQTFNINHVGDFTIIICDLLTIEGFLSETNLTSKLGDIIRVFRDLDVIYETAFIAQIVIEKFKITSEPFSICSIWMFTEGVNALVNNNQEYVVLKLLQILNFFYGKFNSNHPKVSKNLSLLQSVKNSLQIIAKNSDVLISFLMRESLRTDSLKLFATVLFKLHLSNDRDLCYKQLMQLPPDPSEWINSEPSIFLKICYLTCSNNKIMWPPSKILKAVNHLVYSFQRFALTTSFLKIICFVYAYVIPDCANQTYITLGDDLLIILSKRFHELDDILSAHISQLYWILGRGELSLKKAIICYWLKSDNNIDILKNCIMHWGAHKILLLIVMDTSLDDLVCIKAADLINNINDSSLSQQIAKLLPVVAKAPKIFNRLIISHPGVPEDREISKKLCEFMSLQLSFVVDEHVFGLCCDYSKELLMFLKTDVEIVNIFCKNYKNILFILKRLKRLNDDTAAKTLRLIKMLLLVQKRNHTDVNTPIETDISYTLNGSVIKLQVGLDTLLILTSHQLLIRLAQESIFPIILKLLSFCQDPHLAEKSYACLRRFLVCYNWLATTSTLNVFVETTCSLAVEKNTCREFVSFLITWTRIIKKRVRGEVDFYLAHTGVIRSYIKRLPSMSKEKINYLQSNLEAMDALKRISTNCFLMINNEEK